MEKQVMFPFILNVIIVSHLGPRFYTHEQRYCAYGIPNAVYNWRMDHSTSRGKLTQKIALTYTT